jgi:hypothetical protein
VPISLLYPHPKSLSLMERDFSEVPVGMVGLTDYKV